MAPTSEPLEAGALFALAQQGFTVIPLVETVQLDRETPVSLFQRLGDEAVFLLESAGQGEVTGRYSFLGVGRRWRLHTTGGTVHLEGRDGPLDPRGPLPTLRALLRGERVWQPPGLPDFFGGAVGYVGFDYVRRLEDLPRDDAPDGPDVDFTFPRAVLVVDHFRYATSIVVPAIVDAAHEPAAAYAEARATLDELLARLLDAPPAFDPRVERLVATAPAQRERIDVRARAAALSNLTAEQYESIVERALAHIRDGDIFQVVLSQRLRRPSTVDPLTLYRVLRALNPSPYMYLLSTGDSHIVGASPEMLVRVEGDRVSTRPIAGTRPRGLTEDDDRRIEHEILRDEKEIAEHVMLVDLGRNDIGRVARPGSVSVDRLAHIERYSHLLHLVSDVSGQLREGLDAFDAFDAVFPAGTLSGAPKVRAMEIIDELEPVRRGPYGGAVGYFALSGGADFAITIRTVVLRQGQATVNAGGGIVADSRPLQEYHECLTKASAPLLALEIADAGRPG